MLKFLMPGIVTLSFVVLLSITAFAADTKAISGAEVCKAKCAACHSIDKVKANFGKDAKYWNTTVNRMISNGAVLSDAEKTALISFLVEQKKK